MAAQVINAADGIEWQVDGQFEGRLRKQGWTFGPTPATDNPPLLVARIPLAVTAVASTALTLALPPCRILRATTFTTTAFTGATVTLALGTSAGGGETVAAVDIKGKGIVAHTLVASNTDVHTNFTNGTLNVTIAQTTPTAVGAGMTFVEYVLI